jgi:hypothetical protein
VVAAGQNFANTDLTADAARDHDIGAFSLNIHATGGAFSYINQTDAQFGRSSNYTKWDANEVRTYINSVERYTIGATETIVNETGGLFDFRVEGDTDANLLFADASADFVGVGTNSPQAKVDIHAQGSLASDIVLNIRNSADTEDILSISGKGGVTAFFGLPCEFQFAVSTETDDLTTGTDKITFRMPYAMTLTDIRASVGTAPTGSTISVGVNMGGVSVLSTDVSIDISEKTSVTASVPPVISTSALTDDAEMTIDIDQIGSTIAGAGLKITLIGTRA